MLDASCLILLYWRVVTSIKDLLLGQIAVEKGYVTKAQLAEVMKEQAGGVDNDPNATVNPTKGTRPLGTLLLSKGYLKEQELVALLEEQTRRLDAIKNVQKLQKVEYLFFRSEEHTSELQSHSDLVCRLLLEKKNNSNYESITG